MAVIVIIGDDVMLQLADMLMTFKSLNSTPPIASKFYKSFSDVQKRREKFSDHII